MRKAVLAVIGLAAVAALMVPALGLGSADGRKVLDAKVLGPVSEPYTGATNAVRGAQRAAIGEASPSASLTGPLVRFMANCGVTKAVVDAAILGTRRITN